MLGVSARCHVLTLKGTDEVHVTKVFARVVEKGTSCNKNYTFEDCGVS